MPRNDTSGIPAPSPTVEVYSTRARMFHWLTVGLIIVQIPVGVYMVYRGATLNIWDWTTNVLYDVHKLVGVTILLVTLARLAYRVFHGAPADEPTIEPWQKVVSHITHWAIYALLIIVAIGGYLGVSYFGAAAPFGIQLPVFVSKDEDAATAIFALHRVGAFILTALIALHIGAALYHHFIRRDNVLRRMAGRPR